MFALCVESSHARGMGHVYRACHLAVALRAAGEACRVFINRHAPAFRVLSKADIPYQEIDLESPGDWEGEIVSAHRVRVWVNDRLDTFVTHASRVKRYGIPLVTFDDRGEGAALSDVNISALVFDPKELVPGARVLRGMDYLILDPEIERRQRVRRTAERLVVTLGGTDTHGVTVRVVSILSRLGRPATVILGPGFRHDAELSKVAGSQFEIKREVPSLIAELERHDVAITGGGMTAFEATASGLPTMVIANESFEIPVGQELERRGCAIFAGHHTAFDDSALSRTWPVESMSSAGLREIGLHGTKRIVAELKMLAMR